MHVVDHETRLSHNPHFWDALIVFLMIIGGATAFLSWNWLLMHPTHPLLDRLIVGILGILGLLGTLLVFWGSFIEPKCIKVNKKSIQIKGLPDMTIAVIADMHVGPFKGKAYLQKVVEKINALSPDLIVIPGDFIYDHKADIRDLSPLQHLHAPLGVFAVLGNHDTGHMLLRTKKTFISYRTPDRSQDVVRTLKKLGIILLRNEHHILSINNTQFALAGTDHCWMKSYKSAEVYKKIPKKMPVILLTHIPDAILDANNARASLMISGHTHGGQIRLPFVGSIYPIPDQLGRAYDQGLFTLNSGATLAITHGIGETMARARLCCMPEILLLCIEY